MLVREAMSTDVVTVNSDADLRSAAKTMLQHGVGSAIVTHQDNPVGIITETDALKAGAVTNRPFAKIPVRKIMSHPLRTTRPTATVRAAVSKMQGESLKKLAVVDGMDLVGIITITDIIRNHETLLKHAVSLDQHRSRWESDR